MLPPGHRAAVSQVSQHLRGRFPLAAALLDWWAAPYGARMTRFLAFQLMRAAWHGVKGLDILTELDMEIATGAHRTQKRHERP